MQNPQTNSIDYNSLENGYGEFLLQNFLCYVQIDTTSDEKAATEKKPSTDGQWTLLKLLYEQLDNMGINDLSLNDNGYLIARIPGKDCEQTLGFMAHVDTADDVSGCNVKPQVHQQYSGNDIKLHNNIILNPHKTEKLSHYIGETIITSDGTTLLGADDKAGIAAIITAARWIMVNPQIPKPGVELIFTPDEETGNGMDMFPLKHLQSEFCFTLDGGFEGSIESECFYAMEASIIFHGNSIHPGSGRGKLVNAISMATHFITMIPRNESPEATDEKYGNYWPHSITGKMERAEVSIMYRSFEKNDMERRTEALKQFVKAVEAAFPGGKVELQIKELYQNMNEELDKTPQVMTMLRQAILGCNMQPIDEPIRGGTDGARLSSMGIPTPNIFCGAMNIHSLSEWVALPAMLRSTQVILQLLLLWQKEYPNSLRRI